MSKLFSKYSSDEKARFCREWEASGLSQSEYCRNNKLNITTFNSWLKKFKKKRPKNFIPVSLPKDIISNHSRGTEALEIVLPDKMKIRLPFSIADSLIIKIIKAVKQCI